MWPYAYKLYLKSPDNDAKVAEILSKMAETDLVWEGKNDELMKKLKDLGEDEIYKMLEGA